MAQAQAQVQVVTLTDNAGNQQNFTLLQVVRIQSSTYALLSPEASPAEPGTVFILRVEHETLTSIESEDEFKHVVAHLQAHAAR